MVPLVAACTTNAPPVPSARTAEIPRVAELSGEVIAYMRVAGDEEYPGAVVVRHLGEGSERVITEAGYPVALTRDRSGIFVAEPIEEPRQRLLLYPIDGGRPTELLDSVFLMPGAPSNSPDGRFVTMSSDGTVPNGIVVLDLETGTATQLTTDGGRGTPRWSPDARWIAYEVTSPGTGWTDVFMVESAGGEPQRLTNDAVTDAPIGWSADGLSIILARDASAGNPLPHTAILDVATGEVREAPEISRPLPAASPGGGWELAVTDETVELRAAGASPGSGRRLSGAVSFAWSPDGEWLVWSDRSGDVVLFSVADGERLALTEADPREVLPVWAGATVYAGN